MEKELAEEKYLKFLEEHYNSDIPLRLGQRFCVKYLPGVACPELFYCEDEYKAKMIIWEKFLNGEISQGR